MKKENLRAAFRQLDSALINAREKEFGPEMSTQVERSIMLRMLDRNWTIFLTSMDYLRQHIGSESYAQRDPAVEYKKRGVKLFNQMVENAKAETVFQFMRCVVNFSPIQNQPTPQKETV